MLSINVCVTHCKTYFKRYSELVFVNTLKLYLQYIVKVSLSQLADPSVKLTYMKCIYIAIYLIYIHTINMGTSFSLIHHNKA